MNYLPHLYQDTRGAVLQIAEFLDISLSDEALDRVVSNANITAMKKTFFVNGEGTFGGKSHRHHQSPSLFFSQTGREDKNKNKLILQSSCLPEHLQRAETGWE